VVTPLAARQEMQVRILPRWLPLPLLKLSIIKSLESKVFLLKRRKHMKQEGQAIYRAFFTQVNKTDGDEKFYPSLFRLRKDPLSMANYWSYETGWTGAYTPMPKDDYIQDLRKQDLRREAVDFNEEIFDVAPALEFIRRPYNMRETKGRDWFTDSLVSAGVLEDPNTFEKDEESSADRFFPSIQTSAVQEKCSKAPKKSRRIFRGVYTHVYGGYKEMLPLLLTLRYINGENVWTLPVRGANTLQQIKDNMHSLTPEEVELYINEYAPRVPSYFRSHIVEPGEEEKALVEYLQDKGALPDPRSFIYHEKDFFFEYPKLKPETPKPEASKPESLKYGNLSPDEVSCFEEVFKLFKKLVDKEDEKIEDSYCPSYDYKLNIELDTFSVLFDSYNYPKIKINEERLTLNAFIEDISRWEVELEKAVQREFVLKPKVESIKAVIEARINKLTP
jgi:hypothetical protein